MTATHENTGKRVYTVLIVDDEEGFLHIMEMMLGRAGFKTLTAGDGEEGLRMVKAHRPDAVILDDMMPRMNGGDACMKIKADPTLNKIPVIMCSAGAKILNKGYVQRIGANGVLLKPCLPEEVTALIAQCLNAQVQ